MNEPPPKPRKGTIPLEDIVASVIQIIVLAVLVIIVIKIFS